MVTTVGLETRYSSRLTELVRDHSLREIAGITCFAVAVLSGKIDVPILGDLRLPAMLAAAILLASAFRGFSPSRLAMAVAGAVLALVAYLLLRSFFDAGPLTGAKRIDLVYLAAQIGLMAVIASRSRLLFYFGISVLGLAALYLVLAIGLFFFAKAQYGLGWGPPGSAATFNRIMFLAFAAALCMASLFRQRWRMLAPLLGAPFLFATLASLQKAAFVGVALAMVVMLVQIARHLSARAALGYAIAGLIALSAVGFVFQERIAYRFTAAGQSEVEAKRLPGSISPNEAVAHVTLNYCMLTNGARDCPVFTLADATSRVTFLTQAVRGIVARPVFGNGVGRFEVVLVNSDTLEPQPYYWPHNLFAEVGYEGGLVGLAFLFVALASIRAATRREDVSTELKIGIPVFMAFIFVATLFAGDFYDSRMLWLSGIILAFAPSRD